MSKKKDMTGAERKAQLLEAGAKLASKYGASNVTRRMVAQAAKVSEGLVSQYLGDVPTAQKAYARKAKALGLTMPSKQDAEAIGVKLRKHKGTDTRKRSAKEVEAIKRKAKAPPANKAKAPPANKPRKPKVAPLPLPTAAPLPLPTERKTAAREPKAPPANEVRAD